MSDSCPCIDPSKQLSKIVNCNTSSGEIGVAGGGVIAATCYPISFGGKFCHTHEKEIEGSECHGESVPAYCHESWCYVDFDKCLTLPELLFKSTYFPGVPLYFSYSACNSSHVSWASYSAEFQEKTTLRATVPGSLYPHQYKLTDNNEIAALWSPEYLNNSIPFQGAMINFIDRLLANADGIVDIKYTFRSRASDTLYPLSPATASVRDVQIGLSDMAIGTFWVTAERLKMVAFTTPIIIDKVVLAVKRPTIDNSFQYQIEKVLQPFSSSLWVLLFFTIIFVAFLSLCFATPESTNRRPWIAFRNDEWKNGSSSKKCWILFRQLLETSLQKGMFFFGAAVDQDFRASLPHKILMFGFAVLVIVSVSAYVANLAAFLTLSGVSDYVDSMEKAILSNTPICAHAALIGDLESLWPEAKFVCNEKAPEYSGVIENYDAGKCNVIAASLIDTRYDGYLLEQFCERDLIYTDGLVMDVPVAFPVRNELAASVSHFLYAGENQEGLRYSHFLDTSYEPAITCSVELETATSSTSANNMVQITPQYMAFPLFVLALFAGIAIIIQVCNKNNTKNAAKMVSEVARLDEKTSAIILGIAQFAHLDADYECNSLMEDDEDGSPSTRQKREVLQSLRQLVSRRFESNRHFESSAQLESSREWSSLTRRSRINPLDDDRFKSMLEETVKRAVDEVMEDANVRRTMEEQFRMPLDAIPKASFKNK